MFDSKSKKERSLLTPLFLKPERSSGPKAAINRRPKKPGMHGGKRRRAPSEYAEQLAEKQKFRYTYGLRESQMRKLFKLASKNPEKTGATFKSFLERRLDNIVFRLGLAPSRSVARQLVSHGHILVNGKKIKSSSHQVKVGDKISIRPQSSEISQFQGLSEKLAKYEAPNWLKVDPKVLTGEMIALPRDLDIPFDISKVVDYYSKTIK